MGGGRKEVTNAKGKITSLTSTRRAKVRGNNWKKKFEQSRKITGNWGTNKGDKKVMWSQKGGGGKTYVERKRHWGPEEQP